MVADVEADFGSPISQTLGESHLEALRKARPIVRIFGEERFDVVPSACPEREVWVLTPGVEVWIETT
jgi:hypothetical protein